MITFKKMNICDSQCDAICHQVNCRGVMNSGVAKAIREKWPQVYENYKIKFNECKKSVEEMYQHYGNSPFSISDLMLGTIQHVPLYDDYYKTEKHQGVINMFAQSGYGYDGKRYTSYDAFWSCLGWIKEITPKGSSIAFPKYIGCCRGGANWEVIYKMIEEVLGKDYNVEICYLEEENENGK